MEVKIRPDEVNPIPELVDGNTYGKLKKYGLLDITGLRNYCIKRHYWTLRQQGLEMYDCLEKLSNHYGLSIEYLRKMTGVKQVYVRKEKKLL